MSGSTPSNGVRDFDFLYGSWDLLNERLVSRLTGSNEWERFEARVECWPILGGAGNVDTVSARLNGQDFEGASLRIYDPATELWSIYWADNVRNALFPPVLGRFVDGVGEFSGDDEQDGVPVQVRFRWSAITDTSARWEQAFSADCGVTWEVNWVNTFTRRLDGAESPPRSSR